jgi:Domain of unknown function (DU1801)
MPKYFFIDEFFEAQRPEHRQLLVAIDALIMKSDARFKSYISFNTIFYKCKKEVIYIGKIRPKTGIEICFMRGPKLKNEHGLLDAKGRKIIAGIQVLNLKDFFEKEEILAETIQEAVMLDEQHDRSAFYDVLSANRKKT